VKLQRFIVGLTSTFKDYKFLINVLWKQYADVYYDLMELIPDEGVEKKHEENRHAEHNRIYYGYIKSMDQYVIGSEEEVTKAVDSKGTVADDNFMGLAQIVSPNLPLSELKDDVQSVFQVFREGLVSQKLVQ